MPRTIETIQLLETTEPAKKISLSYAGLERLSLSLYAKLFQFRDRTIAGQFGDTCLSELSAVLSLIELQSTLVRQSTTHNRVTTQILQTRINELLLSAQKTIQRNYDAFAAES